MNELLASTTWRPRKPDGGSILEVTSDGIGLMELLASAHPALLLSGAPERLRVLGALEDIRVCGPFIDYPRLDPPVGCPVFTLYYAMLRAPWTMEVRLAVWRNPPVAHFQYDCTHTICLPPEREALQVELDRMEGMGMRAWLEEAGVPASDELMAPEDVTDGDKVGAITPGSGRGEGRIMLSDGGFSIEMRGTTWVFV